MDTEAATTSSGTTWVSNSADRSAIALANPPEVTHTAGAGQRDLGCRVWLTAFSKNYQIWTPPESRSNDCFAAAGDRCIRPGAASSRRPLHRIELSPNRFPSVSAHSATQPNSPMENLGRNNRPPAAATRAASTAQSSTLK